MKDVDNVDIFVRTTLGEKNKADSGSYIYIIRIKKNGEDKTKCGYKTLQTDEERVSEARLTIAAINDALGRFTKTCIICIHTQCLSVKDTINNHWAPQWKERGWIKGNGKKAENTDLWEVYEECSGKYGITASKDVEEFQRVLDDALKDVKEGRTPNVDKLAGADMQHGVNEAEYEPA
jgi:ribonuclease HI